MTRDSALNQTDFDSLLSWLDADRDQAGMKYEAIRLRLIKFFTCRARTDAEDLADETINRVTLKATKLAKDYVGDPVLYFYAVAQKVFLEALRKRPPSVLPPPIEKSDDIEQQFECLDRCLVQLTAGNRELVLEYYQNDKRAKIEHRKALAEKLGLAQNALRIRAHRIRLTLQQCVQGCLGQGLPA
jgi:DNA-directed RNA polymerase specialized sigma24 family protein